MPASGIPQPGKNTSAACITSQAPTTYRPAVLNMRRRRSAAMKRDMEDWRIVIAACGVLARH